jgi:hypothetical protein
MNARANVLGLSVLLLVACGFSLTFVTITTTPLSGLVVGFVVGFGCFVIYLVGMLVGRADEKAKGPRVFRNVRMGPSSTSQAEERVFRSERVDESDSSYERRH